MNDVKRILIVSSLSSSLIRFRGELIKAFINKGYTVSVIAPNLKVQNADYVTLSNWGVQCYCAQIENTGTNIIKDIWSIVTLCRLIRRIRPTHMFNYTIKPVIYGGIAARLMGIEKTTSLITGLGYAFIDKSSIKSKVVNFIAQKLYRLSLKFSSIIFFQNQDDKKLFSELGIINNDRKCHVVNGSGVDLDYYFYNEIESAKEISFLMISRLIADKGIFEFVEAARMVKNKHPSVVFRLVGWIDSNPKSISKETLQSWVDEGTIEYLGKLDDVRPAIQRCSVYVLPSYREGTPRSVLEALSMGRCTITTDAPGCRETVIDKYNGRLVPVKNVFKLVEAMEYFIKEPEQIMKMGYNARQLAIEKYDVKKVNSFMMSKMGGI